MTEEKVVEALSLAIHDQAALTWDGVAVWAFLATLAGVAGLLVRYLKGLLSQMEELMSLGKTVNSVLG